MKKSIRFILIIFQCFIFLNINAQEKWPLEKCIDYALTHNIQLKQQSLAVDVAKEDLLLSKAMMLPNLNGNGSNIYNFGQTIDLYTNTFATERIRSNNFYLSSSVTIFNGFQLLNSVRKNQLNLLASKYDVEKMYDDLSLQIATAYLNILFNIELTNVARSQLDITQQQVERTRKLVDAGILTKGSLLTLDAQAATEELQLVNVENTLDLSYLILVQMLDLPSTEGFIIDKPEINLLSNESLLNLPEQIYDFALSHQPGIKSAEITLQSSKKDIAIAQGTRSPILALSGSLGTGYSGASKEASGYSPYIDTIGFTLGPVKEYVGRQFYNADYEVISFGDQIEDNFNQSFGFYLSVPLFNGLQTKTAINKAKLGFKNAEYNLQLEKLNLYKTIYQAYADANAALNQYNAGKKSVDALQEAFKYTDQKFNVGMINSVEYNDAKNKLNQAQSDLLRAKYNFVFRKTILDFYQGKPLSL